MKRMSAGSAKDRPAPELNPAKAAACVLPASPFVPSVEQNLECCLHGLRDCLTKMRQTEITDRAIRAVDRALKLMDIDLTRPASLLASDTLCAACRRGTVDAGQCLRCGAMRRL